MAEKKEWNYSGRTSSGPVSGVFFAANKEEAEERVKRMGLLNATVSEGGKSEPPKNLPAPPPPNLQSGLGQIPTKNPSPPFVPPPMTALQKEQQDRLMATAKFLETAGKEEEPGRRRHSFIIGEHKQIQLLLEPYLAGKNGKIIDFEMRPNHVGQMIFAVVVEHVI